jgi:hypothetical protein
MIINSTRLRREEVLPQQRMATVDITEIATSGRGGGPRQQTRPSNTTTDCSYEAAGEQSIICKAWEISSFTDDRKLLPTWPVETSS